MGTIWFALEMTDSYFFNPVIILLVAGLCFGVPAFICGLLVYKNNPYQIWIRKMAITGLILGLIPFVVAFIVMVVILLGFILGVIRSLSQPFQWG
jgi:hypothetical protein